MPLYDYTVSQSLEGTVYVSLLRRAQMLTIGTSAVQRRQSGAGADPACKSLAITLGGLGGLQFGGLGYQASRRRWGRRAASMKAPESSVSVCCP